MTRAYWLVKSEPDTYSWDDLVRDGATYWDGVRNYQARNHLREMRAGDRVLFYHSQTGKQIVGVAKVTRRAYQDPTTDDDRWLAVDVAPLAPLAEPVSLAQIKADAVLCEIPLVTHSRLSVMPIAASAYSRILKLGRTAAP